MQMKVARMNGHILNAAPEFDDCRRVAEERDVPLKKFFPKQRWRGKSSAEAAINRCRFRAAKPKFYFTTPIYYTNGLPHIGHTYSTIVCDTIRRYKRMCGYDVVMTTGTDEHGVNVERRAEKAAACPQDYVDEMAARVAEDLGRVRNSGR